MTDQQSLLAALGQDYRRITGVQRTLRLSDRIEEDLGLDSLSAMELFGVLEDRLQANLIDDPRARKIRTVGDLVNLLMDYSRHSDTESSSDTRPRFVV